jgi:hypothetical protein
MGSTIPTTHAIYTTINELGSDVHEPMCEERLLRLEADAVQLER